MNEFEKTMRIPADQQGDTLTARLNRAKALNRLAEDAELIDLEAKTRIADQLPRLIDAINNLNARLA